MQDILYIMTTETAGVLFAAFAVMYILIPCLYVACMKKYADYLVVCKFCINTHTHCDQCLTRVNLFFYIKICKGGNSFFGSFPSFLCSYVPLCYTLKKAVI